MEKVIQISNVTQKGQVTIPVALRRHFDLGESSKVMFSRKENKIILKPLPRDITNFFGYHKKLAKKTLRAAEVEEATRLAAAKEIAGEGT